MNKKIIISLAKKELFGFINSALAYVIIIPFLLIATFLYFRTAIIVDEASLRPFFELLPWLLLFLTPALSMNLLSEEQSQGTMELLLAHPLSEAEIVLGKFFGVFSFFLIILLLTIGLPITLLIFSKPDIGIIFSQYLGAIFLASTFLSIGLLASAWMKSSIAGFLTGLSINFGLILIGLDLVLLSLPWPFNLLATRLAILPHMQSISRGALDFQDLAYFLSLTTLFLILTIIKISTDKLKEDKLAKFKLNFVLALTIIAGVGLNILFQFFPLRLDLTKGRLYSLSAGTKQTLKNLPETVKITVYESRDLPGSFQLTLKQIDDLLKDLSKISNKLEIEVKYPDIDNQASQDAQEAGIQEVTFNKIGASKVEMQTGFLGLVISFNDKKETIAFIENTADLEYQLLRRIRKLISSQEKTIGFYNNDYLNQYQFITQAWQTQYQVKPVDIEDEAGLSQYQAIIIVDANQSQEATISAQLKDYLAQGGKAMVLTKGVVVNPQQLMVDKGQSEIGNVLADYGIRLNQDLVYDLELNEPIALGQGTVRYILPYPFWLKALPASDKFSPLANIDSITLGWPSSFNLEEKDGITYTKFLKTSLTAGQQTENFTISPQLSNNLPVPEKKEILLGLMAETGETKLAVISDFNLMADQFIQGNQQNLSLLSNLTDWLLADKDLAAIPSKATGRNVFRFKTPLEPIIIQYGNILLPSVITAVFALFWLNRRKKLSQRNY